MQFAYCFNCGDDFDTTHTKSSMCWMCRSHFSEREGLLSYLTRDQKRILGKKDKILWELRRLPNKEEHEGMRTFLVSELGWIEKSLNQVQKQLDLFNQISDESYDNGDYPALVEDSEDSKEEENSEEEEK